MSDDHTEPQMVVVGPRRRGRPKAAEPGSSVSIWIPARRHEFYAKLAAKNGQSISKTVGLLLETKWQRSGVE